MGTFQLNRYSIILLTALLMVASGNISFFEKINALYPVAENIGFIFSLSILLTALLILLMAIMSIVIPVRILAVTFLVITAISGYFSDKFGIVIDADMIRNTLETNTAEAVDLISGTLLIRLLLLAVIPAILLFYIPYRVETWRQKLLRPIILSLSALALIAASILLNGDQFASFFREHKSIRHYANPSYTIYSFGKFITSIAKSPESNEMIPLEATLTKEGSEHEEEHYELTIMVVGETARADHFSHNGYQRETNAFTKKYESLISYDNIASCGTSTAISVPCMFSYHGRQGFDVNQGRKTENILDLLQKAGVNILWRDNNSDSKGMATRVEYQDFRSPDTNLQCDEECRDVGMLDGLQEYINSQQGDILIVLHQMGSHGPAYYKRYPKSFEYFSPTCQTSELSQCTPEEIINTYDNTIRYTDYFLSQVIEFLKKNTPQYETAMLYISDHGESLGEGGLYLHGMPYSFAPESQTHVPLLLWAGESSDIDVSTTGLLAEKPNSHDIIFKTLLDIYEIETNLSANENTPLITLKPEEKND